MKYLKILMGSLFYGLRDTFFLACAIVVVLGLLALIFSQPWALLTVLVIIVLAVGHDEYKQHHPEE